MKKIVMILFVVLMLMFAIGYSQQMVYVTGVETVSWDPVVMTGDISYEVFVKKGTVETFLGATTLVTYDVDVTPFGEGTYVVGVRTIRIIDGITLEPSDINWSNINGLWTPFPFVLAYYQAVPAPENLRIGL